MANDPVDLGSGYSYTKFSWAPDRSIESNRINFADVPDVKWAGIILKCEHGEGGIHFKIPGHRIFAEGWDVLSWGPLTLAPSILRRECGCHGYIREGKWVSA